MAEGDRLPPTVGTYRDERPLSDLIPPDRRRLQSVMLVSASMFTGAMLVVLGQQVYDAVKLGRQGVATPVVGLVGPRPRRPPAIFSAGVAARSAWEDRASAVDGPTAPDGKLDPRIDVYLEGRFVALVLVPVGASAHRSGRPWDTIVDDDPLPSAASGGFDRGTASWQLAVFDGAGDRSLQRADGSLIPLGEGRRLVHLFASDDGTIEEGTPLQVYGELADGSLVAGPAFALRDALAGDRIADIPSGRAASPIPFDRGAAAARDPYRP